MGGPALAGLNKRPYCACRSAMLSHMEQLARYCESTWTLRTHARTHAQRRYVYRVRRTAEEVEKARLQRALAGSLNTGLMPSLSLCAKGRGSTTFASDLFPVIGSGRVPQAPYSVAARRKAVTNAPTPVTRAPPVHSLCPAQCLPACSTCKRPRIPAAVCCSKGHHTPGHIDRRPLSKVCALHGFPPCPRCTRMQRGVQHFCARGHHKVCTPAPTRTRPAAPPEGPRKRQCLRSAGSCHYSLMRSPHVRHTASHQAAETQYPPPPPSSTAPPGRTRATAPAAFSALAAPARAARPARGRRRGRGPHGTAAAGGLVCGTPGPAVCRLRAAGRRALLPAATRRAPHGRGASAHGGASDAGVVAAPTAGRGRLRGGVPGRAGLAKRAQTPPLAISLTSARDATSAHGRARDSPLGESQDSPHDTTHMHYHYRIF